MSFNDYFQREILTLRRLGREAMAGNPALEQFFGAPGRDQDVERLVESFAFLTARLQQKLGDEMPEITQGLFGLLWPNYLRPLPAASIIQYNSTGNTSTIPRGTLVESVPVEGTRCQFRTVYDVDLLPLRIVDQRMIERGGTAIIALRFTVTNGRLQTLPLSRLRIFLSGADNIPHTLYVSLLHHLKELRFVIKDGGRDGESQENVIAVLPPSYVRPLGFLGDEAMLPYPKATDKSYTILQEYFCYPEKFLFVEVSGLEQGFKKDALERFGDTDEFELHFVLDHLPEGYESFQASNWKLFCTPVINVFPLTAKGQKADQAGKGYKIVPDTQNPDHYGIYSVEQVGCWTATGKSGDDYENMDSFERVTSNESTTRYHLRIVPTFDYEKIDAYVQIEETNQEDVLLRIQLLCTNGALPKRLGLGDICIATESAGATSAPFKNILPILSPLPPPCATGGILWQLLSNQSLTSIPLTDVAAFRAMIAPYAFRAKYDSAEAKALERHLQGIRAIKSPATDRVFNGIPRRGAQTRITMDQSFFACEGAMYLFCGVLNEFLSMYATVNSFHQLIVKEAAHGNEYIWPPRLGSVIRQQ